MPDVNLGSFAESFAVSQADIRLFIGYDSRTTGAQTATQGSIERAIAAIWPMPLRSDETPALVGFFGGTNALNSNSYIYNGTHGWTFTTRNPGATWSDGSNNLNGYPTTEFTIAGDSSRTAYVDGASANGNVWSMLPQFHLEAAGGPGVDFFGGNPFSSLQCHARHIALGSGSAGPADMQLRGIRHVDFWPAVNTLGRTAYPTAPVTMNFSGTTVISHDVDCGAGIGLPGFVLCNPTSVGAGVTARRIFHQGGRIFRSSGAAPIAGFHLGAWATGGHTIGAACASIGLAGHSGLSPDPYISEANVIELLKAGWGRGTGNNAPTHILCFTGANYAGDEQAQLGAGIKTLLRDRHIAYGQKMSDLCSALNGGVRPKICFVFNQPHRNGFSGLHFSTALAAVQDAAAAVSGASVCDLFTPTNSKSLAGSTPWASPFKTAFSRGNTYETTNSASSGPILNGSADYVHHSRGGDVRVALGMWCRMFRSIGKDPGIYIGQAIEASGASARTGMGIGI